MKKCVAHFPLINKNKKSNAQQKWQGWENSHTFNIIDTNQVVSNSQQTLLWP